MVISRVWAFTRVGLLGGVFFVFVVIRSCWRRERGLGLFDIIKLILLYYYIVAYFNLLSIFTIFTLSLQFSQDNPIIFNKHLKGVLLINFKA